MIGYCPAREDGPDGEITRDCYGVANHFLIRSQAYSFEPFELGTVNDANRLWLERSSTLRGKPIAVALLNGHVVKLPSKH